MSDATDNIKTSSSVSIDYTENNDFLSSNLNQPRINQQQILPAAIVTRSLGKLFSNNPPDGGIGTGNALSIVVNNSTSASFLFYVSDNQGREIIAVPDVAFYVGSEISADTQWPNTTYGMGNMPTSVFNDWGLTDNFDVVTRAVIRNNTGADQNVICVCRHRIIANPGQTTTQRSLDLNSGALGGEGGGGF